eukprot:Selendium_serpulae@DN3986_c0_g1_i2.p2
MSDKSDVGEKRRDSKSSRGSRDSAHIGIDVDYSADVRATRSILLGMKPVPEPIIVEPPTPPSTPMQSPAKPMRVEVVPPPAPPTPTRKPKKVTLDLMDMGFQDQRIGTPKSRISHHLPQPVPVPSNMTSGLGIEPRGLEPVLEGKSTMCACI